MNNAHRRASRICRDVEAEAEAKQETPWAQQEAFEAEQIKKAASRFGAKDHKSKSGESKSGGGRVQKKTFHLWGVHVRSK